MKVGPRTIVCIVGTVIVFLLSIPLAIGRTQQRPQMAGEVFKNVPALKELPVDEFMDTMGMFSASLSMNCTDCHTAERGSSWEKYADEIERPD